ncbi:hypothetical protein [Halopiger goleimassiliensis]|uniref:hypothetical protein n=1 Tax=Halopiger goleimassiliensis TaxID=1293048 RepID=UPI000678201E|nr:hypothetical protein [Halopiger goleimassiliensis]
MPSDDSSSSVTRRLLLAAGIAGSAGVVGLAGVHATTPDTDSVETTRTLSVADETDVDEMYLEPAGTDGPDGGEISQRCDPDPGRIESRSHIAHLSFVEAWNERYRLWSEDEGSETGVSVQNSLVVEKAPERVDGQLVYGVRLHSLSHVTDPRFASLGLRGMEQELTVDPAVDLRTVLPSNAVDPRKGVCTLTLLVELPSGWNAGYEQTAWVNEENEGRFAAERGTDGTTLSYEGDAAGAASMEAYLELRSDRPLSTIDDVFEWTVRGDAERRGL